MKENFIYGLKKISKYILVAFLIGLGISTIAFYVTDFSLSVIFRVVGGVFVFIGLASQLGSNSINRDYNYNMGRIGNPNIAKHERRDRLSDGSIVFMSVMTFSGILIFIIGYLMTL